MCIVVPLISVSFIFSPYEVPDVMKLMPSKNKEHLKELRRFAVYFAIRFIPISIMTVAVYTL